MFLLLKEEKKGKNDNWNFWIWFFCPKMAVSWRISLFQKMPCWNPIFIVLFGCALFGPICQKRETLGTHQKVKRLIIEKLFFWYFWCFLFFLSTCLSFFFVSLFFLFVFVCSVFLLFPFLALLLIEELFFLEKGIFYFWLSPFVYPEPFLAFPLFQFLFLCLSLVLFFLLPSCHSFLFSFGSLFLSLSLFYSVFFAFVSWKEQHQNIQLQSCFSSILSLWGFLSCFSLKSLFLIFAFQILSYVFVQHQCF